MPVAEGGKSKDSFLQIDEAAGIAVECIDQLHKKTYVGWSNSPKRIFPRSDRD